LLIASVAFKGEQLQDAKLGVLISAVCASLFTWLVFRATAMLPKRRQALALLGTSASIIDLQVPVEPGRDHVRGPEQALVTVVEYGDFECPYCGRAEPVVRELLRDFGDVRYVWRHLPLNDVHPHAQQAAEAAEAAAAQGAFWAMHDRLLGHQQELGRAELMAHAAAVGIDIGLFADTLRHHAGAARIAEDVDGADLSGVTGTPTFFVNGHRHYGSFDVDALAAAVQTARARALVARQP
jgi:protein-disulfide isomerase